MVKITLDNWQTETDKLKELRSSKKEELSKLCEENILSGFSVSLDKEYRVSYDKEAQVNLQERWLLFENNMIESIVMTLHTKEGSARRAVNKEEFTKIYLASVKAKEDKISRLRDVLFPIVDEALSKKQLNAIQWDSEVVLPEEPSVVFDEENTIDKRINKAEGKNKQTDQKLSMTNSALLELTYLTMTGGI